MVVLADSLFYDRLLGSELATSHEDYDHMVSKLDGFTPSLPQLGAFLAVTPNTTYSVELPTIKLRQLEDFEDWIRLTRRHPDIRAHALNDGYIIIF